MIFIGMPKKNLTPSGKLKYERLSRREEVQRQLLTPTPFPLIVLCFIDNVMDALQCLTDFESPPRNQKVDGAVSLDKVPGRLRRLSPGNRS
jgi:hypothetical protein